MKNHKPGPGLFLLSVIIIIMAAMCGSIYAEPVSGKTFREEKSGNHFFHVKLPPGYDLGSARRLQYREGGVVVDLYARDFSQGNMVYCEIYADSKTGGTLSVKKLTCDGMDVPVTKKSWGFRGFFPIPPEVKTGTKKLSVRYSFGWRGQSLSAVFTVSDTKFPYSETALDLGKYSDVEEQKKPEVLAFIKESSKRKKAAFASSGEDIISSSFSHPRDLHYITSPFWSKRVYMRYREKNGKKIRLKNKVRVHRGLDLRGVEGSPLFALADGRVVLAEKLYYEGNMLILDHGNRIFSYYMHLNSIHVKKRRYGQGRRPGGRSGFHRNIHGLAPPCFTDVKGSAGGPSQYPAPAREGLRKRS